MKENKAPPLSRTDRQKLGIKRWIESGSRGTWRWSTGVGKTFGAIMAIKLFLKKHEGKRIVVIVPTDHLKNQWLAELSKFFLMHLVTVEIINSAINRDDKIDFAIFDRILSN